MSSRNKLVLPGDAIGVEEEFIPVSGAYVDTGGFIRSMIIGLTSIDVFKKTLVIKKIIDKPIVPKQGDIVEGVISSLSDDIAFIDIYAVNNRYDKSIDFTGV
ncbi:MAG: RNA-binding protein, partial [Desulfurococcaceae archaeon]